MDQLYMVIDIVRGWLELNGITVVIVIVGAWLVSHFLKVIVTRVVRRLVPHTAFTLESEEQKREDTLISIIQGFLSILIWIIVIFFVLERIGIPVGPLLTGAGIIGVAVGFGSQSLVKDILSGIFIIAENQFRIGDVIAVGEYSGTVEGMTLRVTRLRQLDGTIHYIPNGEITVASNKSKDYSMVDLKIDVGYDTQIDHLEEVINAVGEEIASDEAFKEHIIETPQFLRIDGFGDFAITARILGKVYPKQQYLIAGELRKRLKRAFEQHDIDIPYPTRVVHNAEDK